MNEELLYETDDCPTVTLPALDTVPVGLLDWMQHNEGASNATRSDPDLRHRDR